MTLPELQKQLLDEAVKSFREKYTLHGKELWFPQYADKVATIESFLTTTLNQAMRKVADKRTEDFANRLIECREGNWVGVGIINRELHSWLNQPDNLTHS